MEKLRIAVTGGAGLIGSHLCVRLLQEGHEVICIDSLPHGDKHNLSELEQYPNFRFILHDVTNPYRIEADQIYNLAAPATPYFFRRHPIETLKTNILGTLHALEAAYNTGATLLQASAGDVYGSSRLLVQGEDFWGNVDPTGVRAANEEGKRASESLCKACHDQRKQPVRIARIFNTYGPGVQFGDSRVLFRFIADALLGKELLIYGNGEQTRCFCYVEDMVDGLIRLMNDPLPGYSLPVNLGSNRETTINELASRIVTLTASSSKIVHLAPLHDDPRHKTPDITRARQLLDWEPNISLDEGLIHTIRYMESLLKKEDRHHPFLSWIEIS